MRTFIFIQKNSSITVTLSAENLEEAKELLFATVKDEYGWYVEVEEGEEE